MGRGIWTAFIGIFAAYLGSLFFLGVLMGLVLHQAPHLIEDMSFQERRTAALLYLFVGAACMSRWVEKKAIRIKAKIQTQIAKEKYDEQQQLSLGVQRHHSTLRKKLAQALQENEYGAIVFDGRASVINEFLLSIDYKNKHLTKRETVDFVYRLIQIYTEHQKKEGFNPESIPEDGLAFEAWVADNLSKFGWIAETTKGSGDQGVDVIARKNGIKVGIQCKRYTSSVGNKAVQEIIAAKIHFDLDKAAVLTNSKGYTKSAQELAATSGVKLLSHYDIPKFDKIFLS